MKGKAHPGLVTSQPQGRNRDRQSVKHTLTPMSNLKWPINHMSMLLDCSRNLEFPGENPHILRENIKTSNREAHHGPRT